MSPARSLVCALSASCIALAPMAVTAQIVVPWGNHDPGELGGTLFFGTGASFPFEVVYTFSLAADATVRGVGTSNDGGAGRFDINGGTAQLFRNNGNANFNDDDLVDSFAFDSTSSAHSFADLAAGSYYYKLTGQVDGPSGGSYLFSSSLQPVEAVGGTRCVAAPPAAGGIEVPWGTHDAAEFGGTLFFGTGATFPSNVTYAFNLAAAADVVAVGVQNDDAPAFDMACQVVRLFRDNGNADRTDDVEVGHFSIGDTSTTHTFANLGPGSYYYRVDGYVEGSRGGSYLLSSALADPTDVPEPSVLALLAGAALVAAWQRRRPGC